MTIRYTGKQGEFIWGIPARNLTDEEWDELTKEQRKFALETGLYIDHSAATEAKAEAKTAKAEAKAEAAAEHKPASG